MAYDLEMLAKLGGLQVLAEFLKNQYAPNKLVEALTSRVARLESVEVPKKVSQLDNDQNFQTADQVSETVQTQIAQAGHLSKQVADAVPAPENALDNTIYYVMNDQTGFYDMWQKIGGVVVRLDDTSVNLENYPTNDQMNAAIQSSFQARIATDENVKEMMASVFGEDFTGSYEPAPPSPSTPEA